MKKNNEADDFLSGLRAIAREKSEDHETLLIHWWCKKYNMPPNHPLLLERYEEDLLIEAMQDQILREKEEKQQDKKVDVSEQEYESLLTDEHEEKIKRKISLYTKSDGSALKKWQQKAGFIEGEETLEENFDEEFEDEY